MLALISMNNRERNDFGDGKSLVEAERERFKQNLLLQMATSETLYAQEW